VSDAEFSLISYDGNLVRPSMGEDEGPLPLSALWRPGRSRQENAAKKHENGRQSGEAPEEAGKAAASSRKAGKQQEESAKLASSGRRRRSPRRTTARLQALSKRGELFNGNTDLPPASGHRPTARPCRHIRAFRPSADKVIRDQFRSYRGLCQMTGST